MINDYMGVINLNENEQQIKELTTLRSLAAIPIGGRYRVIDFALSNLANAGIKNVGIFTKHKSRSLMDHVNTGKPWDLNRKEGGLFVFNFNVHDPSVEDIKMFSDNMDYFRKSSQEHVIITPSYMICNIDYKKVIEDYEKSGCDITIVYKKINNGNTSFYKCDSLNIDEKSRVLSAGKNIGTNKNINLCTEMFVMKKSIFMDFISLCITSGAYRKIKESIYGNLSQYNVRGYEFKGYLECVNSTESYFKINQSFLSLDVVNELFYDKDRFIYTKNKYGAPTKYSKNAEVTGSIIANGSIIDGTVKNSVISRSVIIEKDALIENCVINQNCKIMSGARLRNVITDKDSVVLPGSVLIGSDVHPFVLKKCSKI